VVHNDKYRIHKKLVVADVLLKPVFHEKACIHPSYAVVYGSFGHHEVRREIRASPSGKIQQAKTVYVDCVCPRGPAVARARALRQLRAWGRFQIVESGRPADLVFLFSANRHLGDVLTGDGPDKRPMSVESTIMTGEKERTC
jgi:hypothetical protein